MKIIFKILGHIFLGLFALIIVGFFIFPGFIIFLLGLAHLCEPWSLDCVIYLIYSPFILLVSVIFYVLSRISDGKIRESFSETKNNKVLTAGLFFGVSLIVLGFIFYLIQWDGPDLITVLIGLFFVLSSIIQLAQNYFKNKKSID